MQLTRDIKTPEFTLGTLSLGSHRYYTCEDTIRDKKIPGITAIPAGNYQVIINESKRFGKRLPLLLNVPDFEGVRIHAGNTAADSSGCVLIGLSRIKGGVANSQAAMADFMPRLEEALLHGDVWLAVS